MPTRLPDTGEINASSLDVELYFPYRQQKIQLQHHVHSQLSGYESQLKLHHQDSEYAFELIKAIHRTTIPGGLTLHAIDDRDDNNMSKSNFYHMFLAGGFQREPDERRDQHGNLVFFRKAS